MNIRLEGGDTLPMGRVMLAGSLALGIAVVTLDGFGYPFRDLFRDPNAAAQQAWWTGSVSLLGLIGWGAAASLFGCAAWVRHTSYGKSETVLFLAWASGIFWLAGIDDAIMLHDQALSRGKALPQMVIFLGYGVAAGTWAIRFRRDFLKRPLLLVSMTCFAISIAFDVAEVFDFLEEYAKNVGLLGLVLAGVNEMSSSVREGLGDLPGSSPRRTQ